MIAFSIGSINIYRYGIFYVISFAVAYFFFYFLAKKKFFIKYPKIHTIIDKHLDDLILYCVLGVLLGGRLGQVFIYDFGYYLSNPLEILQFWKGGMSFIGGMFGVVIAVFILIKKNNLRGKDMVFLLDLILSITPFGIAIGRIGNFLNQELYGLAVPYDFRGLSNGIVNFLHELSIFHVYDRVDDLLRINTNFLSSFFEGFILLIISVGILSYFVKKGLYRIGRITGIFLVRYSFVRFFLEYFRIDSQSEFIFYLSKSQWFFVVFFLLGLYFLLRKTNKIIIK